MTHSVPACQISKQSVTAQLICQWLIQFSRLGLWVAPTLRVKRSDLVTYIKLRNEIGQQHCHYQSQKSVSTFRYVAIDRSYSALNAKFRPKFAILTSVWNQGSEDESYESIVTKLNAPRQWRHWGEGRTAPGDTIKGGDTLIKV